MRVLLSAALAMPLLLPIASFAAEPATCEEAAAVLDLRSLPVPDGAEVSSHRRIAKLSFSSKESTDDVFGYVDKLLKERGFRVLPGGYNMQGMANSDYEQDGFVVHVSVFPNGAGGVSCQISHQGNVPLEELPVPESAEKLYGFTTTIMYKSPDDPETTAAAVRQRMTDAGWSLYGGVTQTDYFRKNAVLVMASVQSAPGQGGATVITYNSELLSLELPAPGFADGYRYSDGSTDAMFDCDRTPQDVADFYREALKPAGWKATTDKPLEIKWRLQTIFRNAGQEMLTVTTHEFEGRTRCRVQHFNAHEVAEDDYLGMSAAGEKAKYRDKKWMTVPLAAPNGLTIEQDERWAARMPAPRDGAFAAADKLAASLAPAGWTREGESSNKPVLREQRLKKEDKTIWIIAAEPPVLEPWVGLVGLDGVEFQVAD